MYHYTNMYFWQVRFELCTLGFTPGNKRLESCVRTGVNTLILQMHNFLSFVCLLQDYCECDND